MSIPDQNILTNLTASFNALSGNANSAIMPYASNLLMALMTISIIVAVIMWLLSEDMRYGELLKDVLKYAAFVYMVTSYKTIINAIVGSFFKIGGLIGGSSVSAASFSNPSVVSQTGLDLMLPIWNNYITNNFAKIIADLTAFIAGAATGGMTSIAIKAVQVVAGVSTQNNSLVVMALMVLVTFVVIACFFIMAINIFVIQIEFAIITAVSIILIPFGVFEQTSFIFEIAKNNIITFGIKYMVLTTILSISIATIQSINMPTSPTYQQLIYLLLTSMGLTAVTLFIPNRITTEI